MRRGIRNLLVRKPDRETGQAAAAEDNEAADDTALGLEVWVEGVDPIVEYASLSLQCHPPVCMASSLSNSS